MINRFTFDNKKENNINNIKNKEENMLNDINVNDYKSYFILFKSKIEENLPDIMKCHYGTYVAHTILEVRLYFHIFIFYIYVNILVLAYF